MGARTPPLIQSSVEVDLSLELVGVTVVMVAVRTVKAGVAAGPVAIPVTGVTVARVPQAHLEMGVALASMGKELLGLGVLKVAQILIGPVMQKTENQAKVVAAAGVAAGTRAAAVMVATVQALQLQLLVLVLVASTIQTKLGTAL